MRQRRRAERGHRAASGAAEQRSQRDGERRRQRLLYVAASAVGALLVILLVGGFYFSSYRPPRKAVALVGEVKIPLSRVVTETRLLSGMGAGLVDPQQALNLLIRNQILEQQGQSQFPVVVLPEEIDQLLADQFEVLSAPDDPRPTSLTPDGRLRYDAFLDALRIGDEEYRAYLEGNLMLEKLLVNITLQVSDTQQQVFMHWIMVDSLAEGEAALERLEQGEEFAVLAQELNQDTLYADENGEVGWVPPGAFPEVAGALISTEPGEVVGPVELDLGVVVVKVTQGPEMREISDQIRTLLGRRATNSWLQLQLSQLLVAYAFNDSDEAWVLERLN
jgi:hypothetical protein